MDANEAWAKELDMWKGIVSSTRPTAAAESNELVATAVHLLCAMTGEEFEASARLARIARHAPMPTGATPGETAQWVALRTVERVIAATNDLRPLHVDGRGLAIELIAQELQAAVEQERKAAAMVFLAGRMSVPFRREAARLLGELSDRMGDENCTDGTWPEWSDETRRAFVALFHQWNEREHPETVGEKILEDYERMDRDPSWAPSNFAFPGLLGHLLAREANNDEQLIAVERG